MSNVLVSRWSKSTGASVLGILACLAAVLALSATQAGAAEPECPNEQLRQESNINPTTGKPYSIGLPDCRAYEMVSPLEKQSHGIRLYENEGLLVSPDGGTVGFASEGDFAGAENYVVKFEFPYNAYLARRGATGWGTSSAFAPAKLVNYPSNSGLTSDFSPDMTSAQVSCGVSAVGKGEGPIGGGDGQGWACAEKSKPDGLWAATPTYPTTKDENLGSIWDYLGGSSDLSRVFFELGEQLLPSDLLGRGLYEIAGVDTVSPHLRLVNVDNAGQELGYANVPGNEHRIEGPLLGDYRFSGRVEGSAYHAISQSGGTVFFTAQPSGEQQPAGTQQTVFARVHCVVASATCKEDNEGHKEGEPSHELLETIAVSNPSPSESQCTRSGCPKVCTRVEEQEEEEGAELGCHGLRSATYQGASADGSKVFFTTEQQLVNGDTDNKADLYEYDFNEPPGHRLTEISAGATTTEHVAGAEAEVEGVVRTSPDGSHVYFVALGQLTEEVNSYGQKAKMGNRNLYGYDTATGKTRFITVNGGSDVGSDGISFDTTRHAQTTPDGNYLVFSTMASGKLKEETTKSAMLGAYRYDFETGQLTWISEGAGKNSAFIAPVPGTQIGAEADIGDWARALSDDGEYVIFTTREKLQGDDVNNALDVYEWHAGKVGLISDGQDTGGINTGLTNPDESVAGMSASGSDIFFTTHTQLVGQDTDVLVDLYDARTNQEVAGGGVELAGFPRPAAPVACSGEGCQGALSPSPEFGASSSSVSPAGGNLPAPAGGSLGFKTSAPKPPTRAQRLAKALKACKGKPRTKRLACESLAKKRYGVVKAKPGKRRGK